MQLIKVTLEIEIPDEATHKDISDFVDVQYGECNGMKHDNPCVNSYEIVHHSWTKEVNQ